MNTRLVPETDKTYVQQMSSRISNVGVSVEDAQRKVDSFISDVGLNKEDLSITIEDLGDGKNNGENAITKETAILFMQINAPEHGSALKNLLYAEGSLFAGSLFVSKGAALKLVTNVPAIATIATATAVVIGVQQVSIYQGRSFTATLCDDVSIGSDARSGCSVVRATNYDVNDISKYCSVIESIP